VPLIAEGVENSEQYLLLKKAGCDVIQGYYFSKPVNTSEFGHLIERSAER
jgi:EAL domain-containing protein (putative c-di-GMP-specific phosphodiesterase class I)